MTKKIILIFLTIIFTKIFAFAYSPYLPKGTLIKVYTKKPISTSELETGSIVYFISSADVWVQEKKAVKKGDIFKGYVSELTLPVQEVNASMKVKITNIIDPIEKIAYELNGRIIFYSSEVLGGNLTNPASYNRTIHPRKVYGNIWGGALQYVPSGEYEFGSHVGINQRDSVFVQLDEDYYINY